MLFIRLTLAQSVCDDTNTGKAAFHYTSSKVSCKRASSERKFRSRERINNSARRRVFVKTQTPAAMNPVSSTQNPAQCFVKLSTSQFRVFVKTQTHAAHGR